MVSGGRDVAAAYRCPRGHSTFRPHDCPRCLADDLGDHALEWQCIGSAFCDPMLDFHGPSCRRHNRERLDDRGGPA
jgi:hypothetical protein